MKKVLVCVQAAILFWAVSAPADAFALTVKDAAGNEIEITPPVKRVVFLSLYELIPVFDVWDRVVGLNRWAYDSELLKGFPQLKKIPSVGTADTVNIEVLLALHPDLVLTWSYKPEVDDFLVRRGLKVISVYPDSLEELYAVLDMCGRLFRKEDRAREIRLPHGKEFCRDGFESLECSPGESAQGPVALAKADNCKRRRVSYERTNQTHRRDQSCRRNSNKAPGSFHGIDCELEPGCDFHLGKCPIRPGGTSVRFTVEEHQSSKGWQSLQGP